MSINYSEVLKTIEQQENLLRFDTFSNRTALDLGVHMANYLYDHNMELAVAIRKLNGNILFQHATGGTNLTNQLWMQRKFNTVKTFEHPSLWVWAWSLNRDPIRTPSEQGLTDGDYAFVGGGFPIRLKNGTIAAVLTVSNLPHTKDHDFTVTLLESFLKAEGVPHLDL